MKINLEDDSSEPWKPTKEQMCASYELLRSFAEEQCTEPLWVECFEVEPVFECGAKSPLVRAMRCFDGPDKSKPPFGIFMPFDRSKNPVFEEKKIIHLMIRK